MKIFTNLLTSLIIAFWLGAIAIFSIQNIEPISLKLFFFESIELPVGILLAFSVGVGILLGGLAPLLWQKPKPKRKKYRRVSETKN